MTNLNFFQGIYNGIPFMAINLPHEPSNVKILHDLIDIRPLTMDSITYIAEDDKAIITMSFHETNISVKDLAQVIKDEVFPECGIDSYTSKEIGDHTIAIFEIPF